MKDEALKLALEALEGVLDDAPKVLDASIAGGLYEVVQCRDAITAIKQALAQPEEEPVAWRVRRHDAPNYWIVFLHKPVDAMQDPEREVEPLYAQPAPLPVQPEERNFCPRCGKRAVDIHTCTPPQGNT